jgi:TRAP-type mannitol/chloroaromatic compound transport system permease small subunit
MMVGATIYAMGLAYTYLHDGHVRVDVIWRLLPQRGQVIADVIASLLFFFPLMIIIAYVSAQFMVFSISAGEKLAITNFHPPSWPLRVLILLGVLLFITQGVAKLIRDLHLSRKNASL